MRFKEWKCGRYSPTLDAICDALKKWHSERTGRYIRKEEGEAEFRRRVRESLSFSNYVDADGVRHDTRVSVLTGKPIAKETEDAINGLLGGRRIADEVLASLPEVKWARREKRRVEREYAKRTGMTDTSEIDTPERKDLRERILSELHPEGKCRYHGKEWPVVRENRLDIVLGLPASGKSTLVVADLAERHGSRVCDTDDVKERLPEYAGGLGCDLVRMEANRINGDALMSAARIRENVVYPVVGADAVSVAEVVKLARQIGYKVHLTFAKADVGIAKGRALARLIGKGRFTEPTFFAKAAEGSERTFRRLAKYADSATVKVTYRRGA